VRTMVYVADIPKVPRAEFEAVIKSLLNTPPMPMSDIPKKREPKPDKREKGKPERRKRYTGKRG
jgi:hypothetical protein